MEEMDLGSDESTDKNLHEKSVNRKIESEMIENETEEIKDEFDEEQDKDNDDDDDDDDDDDEEDADEAEVKILETSLAHNPYDYASHVALINKLQKMGELERLRAAREDMSSKYPLSPDLWLSWMRDEIKLATTIEQKAEVVKLCERAVKDYLGMFFIFNI